MRGTRPAKVMPTKCRRTGKVRFRTLLDAKIVLAKRSARDKGEVRAYRCQFCHGFHLTSQRKREAPGD